MHVTYQFGADERREILALFPWSSRWKVPLLQLVSGVLPGTILVIATGHVLALAIAWLIVTGLVVFLFVSVRRRGATVTSEPVETEVSASYLESRSNDSWSRWHWSAISQIGWRNSYLIFDLQTGLILAIPQRAFADRDEALAFEERARNAWRRSQSNSLRDDDLSYWENDTEALSLQGVMRVEFTPTTSQFHQATAIASHPADSSGRSKGSQVWPLLFLVTLGAVTATVMTESTLMAVSAFLLLIFWPVLVIQRISNSRSFRLQCRRWRIAINASAVRKTNSQVDVYTAWSELKDVRISKKLILLVDFAGGVMPIPKDAFPSTEDAMHFFETARESFQRAKASKFAAAATASPAVETGNPYQSPSA